MNLRIFALAIDQARRTRFDEIQHLLFCWAHQKLPKLQ